MLRWILPLPLFCAPAVGAAPPLPIFVQDEAEEAYRFLAGLYAQEHWDLAAKEAESFLRRFPRHPKADLARYRLAGAWFARNRWSDARPQFEQLARLDPFEFREEVHLRWAQCEREAGQTEKARAALQVVRAGSKDYLHPHAAFLLAEIEFGAERYQAAQSHFADNLELAPQADTAAASRRGLAWCALRLDQTAVAAQHCQAFRKQFPQHEWTSEVTFVWGEALLAAEKPREALERFAQIPPGPFHDAALRGSGFAHAALQDSRTAAAQFAQLLEEYPQSPYAAEAQLHAGAHWLQAGDARAALRVLAQPKDSRDVELLYWRAKAQAALEDPESALSTCQRALQQSPTPEQTGRLQALRGEIHYAQGRHDEAAAAFGAAESDYALHAAATAHLAAGRHHEARTSAEQLLERFPESPYALHARRTLAEALFAEQRFAEAQPHFVSLYQNEGAEPATRSHGLLRYAWCRYFQEDRSEAAKAFDRVLAEFADQPGAEEAAHLAARCHFELQAFDAAQERWRRYLQSFPQGAYADEALLGLARCGLGSEPLQTLLRDFPQSDLADDAQWELARWHESQGDWSAAGTHYHHLLQRFPGSEHTGAARYGLAWSLHSQGNPAHAVGVLQELLRSDVSEEWRIPGAELLLWCAIDAGQLPVAEQAWGLLARAELPQERRFANAHKLGIALQAAGQGDQAWQVLRPFTGAQEAAVQRQAWTEGVWIALDSQDWQAARSRLRAAQKLSQGEAAVAEATFFVGESLYAQEQWPQAAQAYQWAQAATHGEVGDQAAYKLGFCYLQTQDYAQAAKAFASLCTSYPASPLWGEGLYLQGEALLQAGDAQAAIAPLETLRKERPQHAVLPKALFRLGQAYHRTGQPKAAQDALAIVVRKHPDFEAWAEAELLRGECLMALQRTKEARSAFDRVLAKDQGVLAARARLQIGQWHLQRDALEDALAEFLKVSLLYSHADEVAEALYRAGDCLEKRGDTDAAHKQYTQALQKHPKTEYGRKAKERLAELAR